MDNRPLLNRKILLIVGGGIAAYKALELVRLIAKAGGPVRTLKDLEGRTLGTPAGGAAARMFPVMAARAGIDAQKVKWTNVAPNLQEQMLLNDQVEASAVFSEVGAR